MKLNPTPLLNTGLLDRDHLAFEVRKLSGHLPVTANKERGWPEHNGGNAHRNLIVGALLILDAGDLRWRRIA